MKLSWVVLLIGGIVFSLHVAALAGDLEPPGPPTQGTMHTLEQIYNIVVDTNSKVNSVPTILSSSPVKKSGQTTSFQTGDDGHLRRGVDWPSPRFTDNGDGTVTDHLTGLMWTKDADIGNGTREWIQAIMDCESCTTGGYSDWHLPQINELFSLIHFGYSLPAVPNTDGTGKWTENDPFIGVQSDYYWSSTTYAGITEDAWYVIMTSGLVYGQPKTALNFVWCVRGGLD